MSALFSGRRTEPDSVYSVPSGISTRKLVLTVKLDTSSATNLAADLKPAGAAAANVKPCCVCKDEKAARDECMLFSNTDDPQKECQDMVGKYKSCMASFGFQI